MQDDQTEILRLIEKLINKVEVGKLDRMLEILHNASRDMDILDGKN